MNSELGGGDLPGYILPVWVYVSLSWSHIRHTRCHLLYIAALLLVTRWHSCLLKWEKVRSLASRLLASTERMWYLPPGREKMIPFFLHSKRTHRHSPTITNTHIGQDTCLLQLVRSTYNARYTAYARMNPSFWAITLRATPGRIACPVPHLCFISC